MNTITCNGHYPDNGQHQEYAQSPTLEAITQHFKDTIGFERLFNGMFDLYNRYGRCFSAVRLPRPTHEEETAISIFFKRDYYDQALIRISLAEFERQVQKIFNVTLRLDTLLEAYFGRSIAPQAEVPEDTFKNKDVFTRTIRDDILPRFDETPAAAWLKEMQSHMRRTYRTWADQFNHEPDAVISMVLSVCDAINALPAGGQPLVRLSNFAEKCLADPHALDFHSDLGPLFLRALAHLYDSSIPAVLEDSIRLYLLAGLLSDGVISQVTVRGINSGDAACSYYNQQNEAHVLSLENACRLQSINPYGNKVFVVENTHVFSALHERLLDVKCTLMCAAGGLTPTLELLLDLCVQSGADIYYSGNIDYKGLTAADKVYLRFPKQFVPWRYGKPDYEYLLSGNDFLLPDDRKDLAMHNDELASLLSVLRKKGKSASSLPLVGTLADDVKELVRN